MENQHKHNHENHHENHHEHKCVNHHHENELYHNHSHEHAHEHSHGEKELSVSLIIISALFCVFGILFEKLNFTQIIPLLNSSISRSTSLILFLFAYLICGKSVIISAISNLVHGKVLDETFLMSISSIGAIFLGKYEEAVAIMILFQIGEKFEDFAVEKSRNSIEEISKLRPDLATIKTENETKQIPLSEVKIGQIIIVKPGERIGLDGKIIFGESFLDTSALTGESVPKKVCIGDNVLSGSINTQGVLEIQTTHLEKDSSLSRILQLVENASENKTKSEQFVTRFSKIYTPFVVICACFLAVIPSLINGISTGNWTYNQNWNVWIYRALMFLVVSCPCAIVISIPLSFCTGITAAAKKGILIKGSVFLETLGKTKIAVFDKTGTLTKGNFVVSHIHATDNLVTENELLALATHTELLSNHPISSSLKNAHNEECCKNVKLENVKEITGKGISALVNGKEILAGNSKLMNEFSVEFTECLEHQNGTIIHVACNKKYIGHILIEDEIKEDSKKAISDLRKCGVQRIVMLTGDNEKSAKTVCESLGIDEYFSQLLSEDKLNRVADLLNSLPKNKKSSLIFVGDGINDAPVLARSDAGISMGNMGSDAAIEASDIVIMEDKPSKIAEGIKISRKTLTIVYENLFGSLGIKVAILVLSAFGLTNMWIAVFGDVGVTILAVLNSIRLLKKEK